MTDIELKKYRDGGSSNTFSFNSNTTPTQWVVGDTNGQLHLFDENLKETTLEICDSAIESFAIHPNGNECIIAFDNNVQVRKYPNMEEEINSIFSRRTLPITHLSYDNDGLHLFISSKEPDVFIQSTLNSNSTPLKIKTFDIGVRTFAISPDNNYICIIDLSGNVLIYLLKYEDGSFGKQFIACNMEYRLQDILESKISNDIDNIGYKISWDTDMSKPTIFVGSKSGGASMFTRNGSDSNDVEWKENYFTGVDDISHNSEQVNLIQFSPNGKFLATTDVVGGIVIWSVNNGNHNAITKFNTAPKSPLKDIAWGPNEGDNYLLVSSNTSWANISDMKLDMPIIDEEVAVKDTSKSLKRLQKSGGDNDVAVESDDEIDWNDIGKEADKLSVIKQTQNNSIVEDNEMDDDDDDDDDNFVVEEDDYGSSNNNLLADDNNGVDQEQFQQYIGMVVEESFNSKGYGNRMLQPAFQPSNTKFNERKAKFLVWNNVGQITFHEDPQSYRYQIQFSNTSYINRNMVESSSELLVMASLSFEGAIFATEIEELDDPNKEPEEARGSTIIYKSFSGHSIPNKDFAITLQNQEAAIAVACGSGWCAVATSKGFLRIFDSTGVQLAVTSLHGDVLCVTGSGSKLAIIYHDAPVGVNNRLCVYIYEINRLSHWWHLYTKTSVPITNQSSLEWCGFDNSLNLVTLDTKGMLRVLMRVSGWEWFPVLDLSINLRPGHKYWPVCIKDSKFIYVLLNGENLPAIYPLPVTSIKPFRVPIIEIKIAKDKQKNEAYYEYCHNTVWEYAKMSSLRTDVVDATNGFVPFNESMDTLEDKLEEQTMIMDKNLAALLQVACRSKNMPVALGIADRLNSETVIQGCIQIANRFGCTEVAARLEEINQDKQEQAYYNNQQQTHDYNGRQEIDHNNGQQEIDDEVDNNNNFTLSRRSSSNKIDSDDNIVEPKVIPRNPFLKNSPLQSPSKRKTVFDNMKDLKTSPSPKKPMLARQTSFSQDARFKKNHDKSII
jgi:hypothetical protein